MSEVLLSTPLVGPPIFFDAEHVIIPRRIQQSFCIDVTKGNDSGKSLLSLPDR